VPLGRGFERADAAMSFDGDLDKDWYCGLIGVSAAYLVSRRVNFSSRSCVVAVGGLR
jgi:hypothetical protein